MSIIVAAIENAEVYLFADTQLTHPEGSGRKPEPGFKIFFIDENTAVAFAGLAGEEAHRRLQYIHRSWNNGSLENFAQKICELFDERVDLIFAQCKPLPKIIKISNKIVSTRKDGFYWIGDESAARHLAPTASEGVFAISSKLSNIILSRKFDTIGGHCVSAKGNADGFKFIPKMFLHSIPVRIEDEGWATVEFGTAATGGFGYTTVVPKAAGVNGWGVFYFQGYFGEFFNSDPELTGGEILQVKAQNIEQFAVILESELGYEVEWCGSLNV